MITRQEAELFVERWVAAGAPPGVSSAVHEFDLGYVVRGRLPPGSPQLFVIDRETGDLSVWPSLPVKTVIHQFLLWRAERPPVPRTWDPAAQARRDLRRVAFPANITYLTLADGRLLVARSAKGDQEPAWCHMMSAPPGMIPYCSPSQQREGVIVSAGCRGCCRGAGDYLSGGCRRPFFSVDRAAA